MCYLLDRHIELLTEFARTIASLSTNIELLTEFARIVVSLSTKIVLLTESGKPASIVYKH